MNNTYIEALGLAATFMLLLSMFRNTRNKKDTLRFRIMNAIACILFVVYGVMIGALSTWVSNGILFFVDIYYIIRTIKE